MSEQQTLKRNQITALLEKLMCASTLEAIPYTTIQKLQWNFKNPSIQQMFLQNLIQKISKQTEVILRLKCWVLVHLLLLGTVDNETLKLIQQTIEDREQIISNDFEEQTLLALDKYLVTQVQLPFISYLKKLAVWKQICLSTLQADLISLGFSELNKIKEILQLKKIFHNYGCYYSCHQYALNLFQTCLLNIKCFWMSVCSKIKNITIQSLKINKILENQYIFIQQAEVVQDLLIQFVYGDKLVPKIPTVLLIKQVNLIKPQIRQLQIQRKRKTNIESTLGIIHQKKIRKLSTATVDTNKQAKKSPRSEEKLNTDEQIEIMDSINELKILLSLENQNI